MLPIRAFLAVPLPERLRNSLGALRESLATGDPGIRWTRPENLHLTLFFFAAAEQETLEKIRGSMLSVKRRQRPFQVDVAGFGAFPDLGRPRVIWLGLSRRDKLEQLHRNCRKSLVEAGVTTDRRPFTPHLTIGRVRPPAANLAGLAGTLGQAPFGSLPVDRLVLYESRLRPSGAEHLPLFTVMLDGEP